MSFIRRMLNIILLSAASNCVLLSVICDLSAIQKTVLFIAALLILALAAVYPVKIKDVPFRLRTLAKGYELILSFIVIFTINLAANLTAGLLLIPKGLQWWQLFLNAAIGLIAALVLLFTGLSRVMMTSVQLGIKWRVLLFFFWWVPVMNMILLGKVMKLVRNEYEHETMRNELDNIRAENEICRTKYPILLIHGVFFRDYRYFNYWGRIPAALKKNGAVTYFGQQQSAAGVEVSAGELAQKIEQLVAETGCEKLNIIAHSKGGLDARYAISRLGMDKYVASLTTINTPHHGCLFADRLLEKCSDQLKNMVARKYNSAMKRLGDHNPDFIAAVTDLTASRCKAFNETTPDSPGVIYQSVASKMNSWTGGRFPQNLSHMLIRPFDGENDGLVSVDASRWGRDCRVLIPTGRRGISHGDMIDLNRENIDGFDVREFYIELVSGLKSQGV